MDAFAAALLTVAIAEIGDRSLLLAIVFGLRYRRPWPVFWGMAVGLLANQLLSALVGVWLFSLLDPAWHGALVGTAFLAMAVWVLVPESDDEPPPRSGSRIFVTAAVTFFILEMADKTQLAVITLAGMFDSVIAVVAGGTLGILLVTTPALWLGHRFAGRLPLRLLRRVAALLFAAIGAWLLLDAWTG